MIFGTRAKEGPTHCDDDREKANRALISAATASIIRASFTLLYINSTCLACSIMEQKYHNALRFSECQPYRRPQTLSIAQILTRMAK